MERDAILEMDILWTAHAEQRQREWEKLRGIRREDVEAVIVNPEQVVPGDRDVAVAQQRREGGLLRVPFIQLEQKVKIVTVYWTSKIEKCWKEEP